MYVRKIIFIAAGVAILSFVLSINVRVFATLCPGGAACLSCLLGSDGSTCCYGLSSGRICNVSMGCAQGNLCYSVCWASTECEGQYYDTAWIDGDYCKYCSGCSFGLNGPKPGTYYSSGDFNSVCNYNCTVNCNVGGWARENCSTQTQWPSTTEGTDCGYNLCTCTYYSCGSSGFTGPYTSTNDSWPSHKVYPAEPSVCYYGRYLVCQNESGWLFFGYNNSDSTKQCESSVCTDSGWDDTSCSGCVDNGSSCSWDSECCTANCVLDYNGSSKVCAPADNCQYASVYYPAGASYTYYSTLGQYCVNCANSTARWVSNSGRFIVKEKSSGNKMILDKNGQLLLAGSRQSWASPNGGDWLVKSAGAVRAWLDDITGNLYLSGESLLEQQTISPGAGSELLIKIKTVDTYVGKIDASGNMQIKGQLGEGCSLP